MKILLFFMALIPACAFSMALTEDSFKENCAARSFHSDLFPDAKNLSELIIAIEKKSRQLDIRARWAHRNGAGSWEEFRDTPEDLLRLKRISNITLHALSLYPAEFFKKIKFQEIYFAKNLYVSDQIRKAMPNPAGKSLIYADNNDLICESGMELRVHHELYHFVEGRLKGSMYAREKSWNGFNPASFKYGSGGACAYVSPTGFQNTGHVTEGFVSRYALLAEEEDKAETFGWMMTEGFASQVKTWTETDLVLKHKRDSMIQYLQKIAPKMDSDFFQKLAQE